MSVQWKPNWKIWWCRKFCDSINTKSEKNKSDASPQNGLILLNRMMKLYLIESVTTTKFRAHHGIDCAIYMRSASYVTRNYVNIIIIFSTVIVIATCTFQSCLLRGNYRYTCNIANRITIELLSEIKKNWQAIMFVILRQR